MMTYIHLRSDRERELLEREVLSKTARSRAGFLKVASTMKKRDGSTK
jgi:hypothetical protein